jgi:hypothetical protein
MRQVMPHRNNIVVRRTKCKRFFGSEWPVMSECVCFEE